MGEFFTPPVKSHYDSRDCEHAEYVAGDGKEAVCRGRHIKSAAETVPGNNASRGIHSAGGGFVGSLASQAPGTLRGATLGVESRAVP